MVLCGTPAGRTGTRKLRRVAGRPPRRPRPHAAGEESDQLDFLYWGDVHFLISATHQMSEALDGLPGGPKLPKRLKDQIHLMRHTVEHWSDDDERKGSWRTLVLKHAPGPAVLSLDELEQVLTRVRDVLLEVYPAKPKLLEVYHGMPQLIESDATGAGGSACLAGDARTARRAVGADRPGTVSSECSRAARAERRGAVSVVVTVARWTLSGQPTCTPRARPCARSVPSWASRRPR
jgi:hypothetical protein